MPVISVIMSVYNGQKYLPECIDSILSQTFEDFEFIIVDDCSTDDSFDILSNYADVDSRVVLKRNSCNIGLTKTLNKMIELSAGDFVARMDADDICDLSRFQKQIDFFKLHQDISVCGTNIEEIKGSKSNRVWRNAFEHDDIKAALFFYNPMPHSSCMMRSQVFDDCKQVYNESYIVMQDYELWQRMIRRHKFHILDEVLLKYRVLDTGVTGLSARKSKRRDSFRKEIYRSIFEFYQIPFNEDELLVHCFITSGLINTSYEQLIDCESWLMNLLENNEKINFVNRKSLQNIVGNYWFNICTRSSILGARVISVFFKSDLYRYSSQRAIDLIRFVSKSLACYDNRSNKANFG